ncbi:hypothetical protein LUX29_08735 [Aureimonas altamirensis]|uniref:hypothetical protein n=1 Tax=Aureimonas altamirensis TaxID=370622 RepID=UPI001E4504A0|nr:hypothetical protein [Aureimonas altamirensis]UHD47245.1 hypothetical protein LUX29_08735 [Aureimonas altamirensis]
MGEFDTDNDMMAEQQARDTDGHSRQPGDVARDIDARSGQDRRAAHTAAMREGRPDDAVLEDNRAHLGSSEPVKKRRSKIIPPLAGRGRSLLGD